MYHVYLEQIKNDKKKLKYSVNQNHDCMGKNYKGKKSNFLAIEYLMFRGEIYLCKICDTEITSKHFTPR